MHMHSVTSKTKSVCMIRAAQTDKQTHRGHLCTYVHTVTPTWDMLVYSTHDHIKLTMGDIHVHRYTVTLLHSEKSTTHTPAHAHACNTKCTRTSATRSDPF